MLHIARISYTIQFHLGEWFHTVHRSIEGGSVVPNSIGFSSSRRKKRKCAILFFCWFCCCLVYFFYKCLNVKLFKPIFLFHLFSFMVFFFFCMPLSFFSHSHRSPSCNPLASQMLLFVVFLFCFKYIFFLNKFIQ